MNNNDSYDGDYYSKPEGGFIVMRLTFSRFFIESLMVRAFLKHFSILVWLL